MIDKNIICNECLNDTKHPFKLDFQSNGVCYGCLVHSEKKNNSIFDNNLLKFNKILSKACKKNSLYQCIVPISGSAEDYFIIDFLKERNIEPLILLVNNHFLNEIAWHNIHNLITHFDLDSISYTPDIDTYKSLVRSSLVNFNDIYWPYRYMRQSYSINMALEKKIPLIIWGMYQPIEYCGKFSHLDQIEMSEWSLKEHELHGKNLRDALSTSFQFNEEKIIDYPDFQNSSQVQGLYLSNYMPWDPWHQNSKFENIGFIGEDIDHTFDQYENVGSSVYYEIHDLLRLEKYGYKKVREHLSREIRHKRISRINAKKLLNIYNRQNYSIDSFFNWLDMSDTGKEWWINHRIPKYNHLIGKDKIRISWKNYFDRFFTQKVENSQMEFVSYMKGI